VKLRVNLNLVDAGRDDLARSAIHRLGAAHRLLQQRDLVSIFHPPLLPEVLVDRLTLQLGLQRELRCDDGRVEADALRPARAQHINHHPRDHRRLLLSQRRQPLGLECHRLVHREILRHLVRRRRPRASVREQHHCPLV
jgi:hypothetical protein